VRFYYPDAFVVCHSNPPEDTFQDEPVVIFEVLSKKTRRADEGDKKEFYLTIPSLTAYVLVEQEFPAAVVYRRTDQGFERDVISGIEASLSFADIGVQIRFSDIYERIAFAPEPDDDSQP
jgi:Uma2 family endonuclease